MDGSKFAWSLLNWPDFDPSTASLTSVASLGIDKLQYDTFFVFGFKIRFILYVDAGLHVLCVDAGLHVIACFPTPTSKTCFC